MNPPSRFEIEQFANEKFQADLDRRINKYAQKQAKTLAEVRARGNASGYVPALIQCKQERLRAEILALADAWVEAGTTYAVPLQAWAEKALEKAAAEMTAGTVSAFRGELDLMATRTRTPNTNCAGHREIENAAKSALREAKLRLKTERIQAERSISDVSASPARSASKPAKHSSAGSVYRAHIETGAANSKADARDATEHTGLQRARYPFGYWRYDPSHERLQDPKAELAYWKDHVWRGYHVLIESHERAGMAEVDRHEKLSFAIAGLSYDLAVLQANNVIDRGLRGEDAMRALRDEAAELLEEVTSSWRASCERLAVTFEDDTEEVKDLAQPFDRVRDDLRRLLPELLLAEVKREPTASVADNGGTKPAIISNAGGQGRKRGPKPDHQGAARVAEIVARLAPDGDWRSRVDDICEALDEAQIPFPARWRKRDRSCDGWAAYDERANAVKAIEYRLEIAKQRLKTTPETLS